MRRRTVALGTLVLALAGCSATRPESTPTSTPAPTPTPTKPSIPETPQTPQTPPPPKDTGTALPTWAKVLRQPVDGQHLVTRHQRYVVTRGSDEAGTTTVTDRTTKRVVLRHVPATGFVAQSPVVIADRWALLEDIRSDGPDPQIKVLRYDLGTGRASTPAIPPVSEPEIGAYDGTFAYSSTDAKNRSCLIVAELATLKSRTVTCVAAPGYVADPVVSADTVTFSEIVAPGTARRCKRILIAPLAGGPVQPVPAATNCLQWSGATLSGATVWSEVGASDPDQYQSKAYLRESGDSPARSLGTVVTDTILACGNWLLWEVRTVGETGEETYRIDRWRPGLSEPQTTYGGKPGVTLTPMTCQDDTIYVEAAYLATSPAYTETIAAAV